MKAKRLGKLFDEWVSKQDGRSQSQCKADSGRIIPEKHQTLAAGQDIDAAWGHVGVF